MCRLMMRPGGAGDDLHAVDDPQRYDVLLGAVRVVLPDGHAVVASRLGSLEMTTACAGVCLAADHFALNVAIAIALTPGQLALRRAGVALASPVRNPGIWEV